VVSRRGRGDLEEIPLGALTARQTLLLMDRKPRLKILSFDERLRLYAKVGGHPKTIELLDGYLTHHSVEEFLKNPDFTGLAAGNPHWNYTFVKELATRLSPVEQEVLKNLAILEDVFDDEAFRFFCKRVGIKNERDRVRFREKLLNLSLLEPS
jgi:hypothetical protein